MSYLSTGWQWTVFIHLLVAFYLWPCSQQGFLCRGKGIFGFWCFRLLFDLLSTSLGSRSSSSLWCHGPNWKACTQTYHFGLDIMTGQVQACLHCSYNHLWLFIRTSRSTPHTSVTDNYRLSAISKNNTRHCDSSFDMFWSSADTGPVPPLVIYHKNNKNFPVYGTHLVTINDANSRLKDVPRHQSRTPAVSECL